MGGLLAGGRLSQPALGPPAFRRPHPGRPPPAHRHAVAHRPGRGPRRPAARAALRVRPSACSSASLWLNRSQPGLLLAMVGIGSNAIAILVNGGYMPVYGPAVHVVGPHRGRPLADLPRAPARRAGARLPAAAGPSGRHPAARHPLPRQRRQPGRRPARGRRRLVPLLGDRTGLVRPRHRRRLALARRSRAPSGRSSAATQIGLDRPLVLGGGMGPGFATSSASTGARHTAALSEAVVIPVEGLGERIRQHPYVRLARDARFSAFWLAGTISLFGDRLHQIALGVMVLGHHRVRPPDRPRLPRGDPAQPPARPGRRARSWTAGTRST